MLENRFVNLVARSGATSTRSPLNKERDEVIDYIFTSPEILVDEFSVLDAVVSDHYPLVLTFGLY